MVIFTNILISLERRKMKKKKLFIGCSLLITIIGIICVVITLNRTEPEKKESVKLKNEIIKTEEIEIAEPKKQKKKVGNKIKNHAISPNDNKTIVIDELKE
jgi:hypothetical protein